MPICYNSYCSLLNYSTAQFKFDSTRVQQGHNMTRFSFHTFASLRVHARLVTSNLPYMSGMNTPNLDYAYANCKSRTAENSIDMFIH